MSNCTNIIGAVFLLLGILFILFLYFCGFLSVELGWGGFCFLLLF